MQVNIYYGGRGLIDDPTLYTIEKIAQVLDELRVTVERYNLYEDKSGISVLPKTLKDADGVILAASVEWYGIGGYLQQFLDACWLYGDKEKIQHIYMLPVVMATTYGEREAQASLIRAWEMLGGLPCEGICAYVDNHVEFETNSDYGLMIEKCAENFYRAISKQTVAFPNSSSQVKKTVLRSTRMALTPQESEQLSAYVSDDNYVKKQKEDIEELASLFKDMLGDEEEMCAFEENITKLEKYCAEYNSLKEEVIIDIIKGNAPQAEKAGNVIVFSVTGKPIIPRSENQLKLVEGFAKNDMVFAIGPAGSGKTYTAIALAVRALKNKEIKKIILSRPAVEAGEKLGFLPGDMKDKIDPYLQPLYDALQDMIPAAKLKEYMELNIIQIAPLAFMRGRTLNDAVVILDEAQNTTTQQIKMFLTRMGMNTKMIITGDMTQIDLPASQTSGLVQALRILKGVKGISFVELNKKDIVRHKLVERIVDAYEKFDKEKKAEREKLNGERLTISKERQNVGNL